MVRHDSTIAILCAGLVGCSSPAVAPLDASAAPHDAPGADTPGAPDAPHSATDAPTVDAAPAVKRLFATRTKFNGKFGGLAAGDQLCNNAAQAAALGGVWIAWLSSTTTNAIDRIDDVGAWYLVDQTSLVFNGKVALTQSPQVMIDTDEYGALIPQSNVFLIEGAWTGTLQGGHRDGSPINDCLDWTAGVGRNGVIGDLMDPTIWTDSGERVTDCDLDQEHLYCFEQ